MQPLERIKMVMTRVITSLSAVGDEPHHKVVLMWIWMWTPLWSGTTLEELESGGRRELKFQLFNNRTIIWGDQRNLYWSPMDSLLYCPPCYILKTPAYKTGDKEQDISINKKLHGLLARRRLGPGASYTAFGTELHHIISNPLCILCNCFTHLFRFIVFVSLNNGLKH